MKSHRSSGSLGFMLDWFKTTDVEKFAEQLVAEVLRRVPPSAAAAQSKKTQGKQGRTREIVLAEVNRFAQDHSLNVYKKAKLANRFKWGLLEAGYPRQFVDELAYDLAASVAVKTQKK